MSGHIGIDISAKSLDVRYLDAKGKGHDSDFEQTPAAHRKLVSYLKKRKPEAIVMEATGIYYLDVALAIDAAGLPLSVINPRAAKHFAKATMERSKTDKIDARLLAEFAKRMELRLWQAPPQLRLALRDLTRRIKRLGDQRTAEKNRYHAYQSKQYTGQVLLDSVIEHIEQLDQNIEQLCQIGEQWIAEDTELKRQFDLLITVKGIAETSALNLVGEFCLLPEGLRSKQLSRHAGMDVTLNQSGSSLDKPGRLSKSGNVYIRSGLHMPSLSYVRCDPYARAHYQMLIKRGKKKMQALCAIQRKLLTGLWACIQNNEAFDSSKLFAIEPENA